MSSTASAYIAVAQQASCFHVARFFFLGFRFEELYTYIPVHHPEFDLENPRWKNPGKIPWPECIRAF